MSERTTEPRRPAKRAKAGSRALLKFNRHGEFVEVEALDEDCGANVLPIESLARRAP